MSLWQVSRKLQNILSKRQISSNLLKSIISFMKTKFRRSFLGAEQVCILIGSWIMTQNANISVSGIYRFCKKCCNQIFSIHHGWIVPLYYVNKTISTNNWVNFWISIIKQLWDLAPEFFFNIQGSYGILDQYFWMSVVQTLDMAI